MHARSSGSRSTTSAPTKRRRNVLEWQPTPQRHCANGSSTSTGTALDAEAPRSIGTGFSTLIDYVRFAGRDLPPEWLGPLVARTHKSVEEAAVARREAAIQDWCFEQAYPAPRVIAVFGPGELGDLPVQVMQRGPHATLFDAVKRAPWRAPKLVDRLAALQLRLHALPIDGWPEPDGEGLAERRLRLVRRWLAAHEDTDLRAALSESSRCCPSSTRPRRSRVTATSIHSTSWSIATSRWSSTGPMPRSAIVTATSRARISSSTSAPRWRPRTVPAKALVGASQGWLSKRFLNAYRARRAARRRTVAQMGGGAPAARLGAGRRGPRCRRRARRPRALRAARLDPRARSRRRSPDASRLPGANTQNSLPSGSASTSHQRSSPFGSTIDAPRAMSSSASPHTSMCMRFFTTFSSGTGITQMSGPRPVGSTIGTDFSGGRRSPGSRWRM